MNLQSDWKIMKKNSGVIGVQKRFLSRKEAAEYLGVSSSMMNRLCFNRKVKYYRPNGKDTYFAIENLDAYIMSGEVIEVCKNPVHGERFNQGKKQ